MSLLRRLLRPHWLVVIPAAVSFLVWIIPWGTDVHRGYSNREPLTVGAVAVLATWYAMAAGAAFAGYAVGRRVPRLGRIDEFPAGRAYAWFTAIAAVGVAWSYGSVMAHDPDLIARAVEGRTLNEVRLALGYGVGVHTLRYASIVAGGLALSALLLRFEFRLVHLVNVALLVAAAAIASRLSIVMALVVALGAFVHGGSDVRLPLRRLAGLVLAGVVAVTAFTYIRNANYYETYYDVSNPLTMTAYVAIAYVGAPFQASVGAANDLVGEAAEDRLPPTSADVVGNYVVNASAEGSTDYWEAGAEAGLPATLALTTDRRAVEDGETALRASVENTSRRPRSLFVWMSGKSLPFVTPGERYLLRARITGGATRSRPIRLGVRLESGEFTQQGLLPVASGTTATANGATRLEGVYTVPEDVSYLTLGIWKERIRPRASYSFAFDGALIARIAPDGPPSPVRGIASYLLPTYAPVSFDDVLTEQETYRNHVDIESNLTTNSVFTSMESVLGALAFPVIALVLIVAAAMAGHASRYSSLVFLAAYVLAYCFAELWRVYLFNAGIVHFLLFMLFLVPVVDRLLRATLAPRARSFGRRLARRG